jgi:peptide/nickel transport system substrate-binding protein
VKRLVIVLAIAAMTTATMLAVSGGATGGRLAATKTLHIAFSADPAPLDPDTYYAAEGEIVMTSAYEGLLQYKPNSPVLTGVLATGWKESKDGLTYTFTLRRGVRFSDRTPFNALAAKASFERRIALKGGPSYMLEHVKQMSTPGPYTFVVRLDRPVAPFLDYLASTYGPLMSSPSAVRAHSQGRDHASNWLGSHTAGTGPYVLTSVQRGAKYVLSANPYYWGSKPWFTTVNIAVIPNFETQRLELEQGSLDVITHGLTISDVNALKHNNSVRVHEFPALAKDAVWINADSKVFGGKKVRAALRAWLNNKALSALVYGTTAVPSTNVYPAGMLPNGAAPDVPKYNPSLLPQALAPFKGQKVVIGWSQDATNQTFANLLQVRLQALGLNASVREIVPAVLATLPTSPKRRPDLLPFAVNPDAVAPDTWARIYWMKGAPVNWLGCNAGPRADALLNQAARQANAKAAERIGAKAAIAYRNSNCFLNIADVRDTIVTRKQITGFVHQLVYWYVIRLASLRAG